MPIALTRRNFRSGSSLDLLARFTGDAGAGAGEVTLVKADVDAIAMRIFDLSSVTPDLNLFVGLPMSAANNVFDTLQPWGEDILGFNVRYRLHTGIHLSVIPKAGHVYLAEIGINAGDLGTDIHRFELTCIP